MYYVYLLKSKLSKKLYIGSTKDLRKRLTEHNAGKSYFTKKYRPWSLLYYEAYLLEKLARLREMRLKHHGNAVRELKKRAGIITESARKSGAGFTLIEIIVYMALLAIFLLTLTDIFVSILDVQLESDATSAVEQDGRFLLSRLAYDINRASSITTPGAIGSLSNSLSIVIGGVTNTYSLNGSNLELINNLGTSNLNGSETAVSSLNFQKIANSAVAGTKETIKINFTISSITQRTQGPEVRNFQTTVGRR